MSFLKDLQKQREKLKETETVVTCADGQRFVEKRADETFDRTSCAPSTYGFVVDTKPDDVPVKVVEYLYIGSQDCAASNVLDKYNIKHVLSLGINVETNVNSKFVECLDLPETDIKPVLAECLPFIDKAVTCKENLLIHCNAGVSRTSMVTIGYLMQHQNINFIDAFNFVKNKRPAIAPNASFRKQLKDMKPGSILDDNKQT